MKDELIANMPVATGSYPWWWRFADPAPDFLKYLGEEEIRVIINGHVESQIRGIKRQQQVLLSQVEDLKAEEAQLTQIKTMIASKRK
jgi:hypothetical protein